VNKAVQTSDITVITPCCGYENTEPLWMFLITCKRFGITPTFYGKGKTYSGWVDIMLTQLMEAARTCPTSHMLYTDSRDAFFLAGMDEITEKYNEAKVLYEAICWMFGRNKTGDWGTMPDDNPPWWCNFMAERPGLTIDHECSIFQSCTNCMDSLLFLGGRILNQFTWRSPCVLHFNGGYTDQKFGKWERMEPVWRQLGYKENPPWQK
jgi:hypothetical protein